MSTTPKQAIYAALSADAQLATSGYLGDLLNHRSQSPYGVYYHHPPEVPDFPLITYYKVSAAGSMPREELWNFTVWANNFEAIHERIHALLHKQLLTSDSQVYIVNLLWRWEGPEVFDEDYNIYTQVQQYVNKGVKI